MYCPDCGKQINDDSKFCKFCGLELNNETLEVKQSCENPMVAEAKKSTGEMAKIHCPRCGSRNIQTIVKTDIKTHGKDFSASKGCCGYLFMGPFGILCGACGEGKTTTAINTSLFTCNDCGHEFKKREDIVKLIEANKKSLKIIMILLAAITVIPLFAVLGSGEGAVGFVAWAISTLPTTGILAAIAYFVLKKYVSKCEQELNEYDEAQRKYKN